MDWIRENQPFISFGLLVGAIVYTVITAFILRMSTRQLRASVQPALTFKRSSVGTDRDARQPYILRGALEFQNSGVGAALNVTAKVAIHAGGAVSRYPKFDTETTRYRTATPAGGDFAFQGLHTAVDSGSETFKQLHEYEVFISYSSIVGAKYLTHISIGQAGTIDAFYVGERSLLRRLCVWIGICWRFYRQWVPIWLKSAARESASETNGSIGGFAGDVSLANSWPRNSRSILIPCLNSHSV